MGADKGYLVEGGWDDPFDPLRTARVLAKVIGELEEPDIIMCGLVSEDGYNGVTGPGSGAAAGHAPTWRRSSALEAGDGCVQAVLDTGDVRRTVKVPTPCVLGIDSQMNVPRLPTVLQVMKVKSRPHRQGVARAAPACQPTRPSWRRPPSWSPAGRAPSSASASSSKARPQESAARLVEVAAAGRGAVMAGRFVVSAASRRRPAARGGRRAGSSPARTAASRPSSLVGDDGTLAPAGAAPEQLAAELGGPRRRARRVRRRGRLAARRRVGGAPARRARRRRPTASSSPTPRRRARPRAAWRPPAARRAPACATRSTRDADGLVATRSIYGGVADGTIALPVAPAVCLFASGKYEGEADGAAAAVERRQAAAPSYEIASRRPRSRCSRRSTLPARPSSSRSAAASPRPRTSTSCKPLLAAPRRRAGLLAPDRRGLQVAAAGAAGRAHRRRP